MSCSTTDFVDELSSNSPAPGGGSVSALAGSLGAALSSMVAALTHEKKEWIELKPEMDKIGVKAQEIKDRLSFLVDEDTKAFNKLMVANRLSSGNDDETSERASAIRQANEYAIEIPLEVAMLCSRVIDLTKVLVEKGNPNSISDVGVAADVALAGVRGASMNVLINLPNVKDEVYCNDKRKAVEQLIQDAETNRNIVFDKTMKIINS